MAQHNYSEPMSLGDQSPSETLDMGTLHYMRLKQLHAYIFNADTGKGKPSKPGVNGLEDVHYRRNMS